ncbi:MAG: hypothetical protein M3P27_13100 [Acidobacteriota bacterium]|nr:hypothetical protein [Acidobacteriota bacterium]
MSLPPATISPDDNDLKKGSVEDQAPEEASMNSMSKQLGQRDEDPALADFESTRPKPPLATS